MPVGSGASVPYNIIAGPGQVWIAPVATAFPAVNASPGGSFIDLGKTQGGISVKHTQTVDLIASDQTTGPIKAVRSAEGLEITFSLIEITMDSFALVMNNQTVTTVAGPPADKDFPIHKGRVVDRRALLCRGDSPYGNFNLQYEAPVTVMTDQPQVDFKENGNAALQCTFTALEDLTAGTESARFGTVRAQTS